LRLLLVYVLGAQITGPSSVGWPFSFVKYRFLRQTARPSARDFDTFRPHRFLASNLNWPVTASQHVSHRLNQSRGREEITRNSATTFNSNLWRSRPDYFQGRLAECLVRDYTALFNTLRAQSSCQRDGQTPWADPRKPTPLGWTMGRLAYFPSWCCLALVGCWLVLAGLSNRQFSLQGPAYPHSLNTKAAKGVGGMLRPLGALGKSTLF
jgi:hypothetical protein